MKRLISWVLFVLVLLALITLYDLIPELDDSLIETVDSSPWMQFLAVAEAEDLEQAMQLDERESWSHPRFSYGKTSATYSYESELNSGSVTYYSVTDLTDEESGEVTPVYTLLRGENAYALSDQALELPDGRTALPVEQVLARYYRGYRFPAQPDYPGAALEGNGSYVKLAVFRILTDLLAAVSLLLLLSADWKLLAADLDKTERVRSSTVLRIVLGVLLHAALTPLHGVVFLGVVFLGLIILNVKIMGVPEDLRFSVKRKARSIADEKTVAEVKQILQARYLRACRHWFRTLFGFALAALYVLGYVQLGFTGMQLSLLSSALVVLLALQSVIIGRKGTVWKSPYYIGMLLLWLVPSLLLIGFLYLGLAFDNPAALYVTAGIAPFLPGLLWLFDKRRKRRESAGGQPLPAETAKPATETPLQTRRRVAAERAPARQSAAVPEAENRHLANEQPIKPTAPKPKHRLFVHSGLTRFEAWRVNRKHRKEFPRR